MSTNIVSGLTPTYSYDYSVGCEVLHLDTDDVVTLLAHASCGTDHNARILRDLFPVMLTTDTLAHVAGPHYAARVEVRQDHDAENPLDNWDTVVSFASLDSWGRQYVDLRVDSYLAITDQPTRTLGRGNDFTAESIAVEATDGGESHATDSARFAYRILHLDGARGITNVGTKTYGGVAHYPAAESGAFDHDAVAWVPRGAILDSAPRPEGASLDYDPATGWRYSFPDGASASAEDAVEDWASQVVAGITGALSDYLAGNVFGISVSVSTCEDDDPRDLDARIWDDAPDGDVWGLYGDDELHINVVSSAAYNLVVDALTSDIRQAKDLRDKQAKQDADHARLLETLTPDEIALLRTLWGERFRHLGSVRALHDALNLEGLTLYYTDNGRWPSLGLIKEDEVEG